MINEQFKPRGDPRVLIMTIPAIPSVLVAVILIGIGLAVGILLEKFIQNWMHRWAKTSAFRGDNIVVTSLRSVPIFWGIAGGLYLATYTIDPVQYGIAVEVVQTFIVVVLLISFTVVSARMASGFVMTYAGKEASFLPATSLIPTLVRLTVYVLGGLIILREMDIEIAPLLTTLGVGGLAVALALQDTLKHVFAGFYLIAARQITPGDYVELESGQEGYVRDINWRSATLETIMDTTVVVPNAELASAIVTNYHRPRRDMLMRIAVGVAYDSDMEHVEQVTKEVALEVVGDLTGRSPYEPKVFFQSFGEFSINFVVFLHARDFYDQYQIRHEFLKRLVGRYKEENIEIPFPIKEFEMELSTGGLEHGRIERPRREDDPFLGDAPAPRDDE